MESDKTLNTENNLAVDRSEGIQAAEEYLLIKDQQRRCDAVKVAVKIVALGLALGCARKIMLNKCRDLKE